MTAAVRAGRARRGCAEAGLKAALAASSDKAAAVREAGVTLATELAQVRPDRLGQGAAAGRQWACAYGCCGRQVRWANMSVNGLGLGLKRQARWANSRQPQPWLRRRPPRLVRNHPSASLVC